MLESDILIENIRIDRETGNTIVLKIMDSLRGLNVTTALALLEECQKEVYIAAKI